MRSAVRKELIGELVHDPKEIKINLFHIIVIITMKIVILFYVNMTKE